MTMTAKGLAKLIEECGELQQVAAKKLACPHTDEHYDGAGSLKERMEDEIADVIASCSFVTETHQLDEARITLRAEKKMALYKQWHDDPNA